MLPFGRALMPTSGMGSVFERGRADEFQLEDIFVSSHDRPYLSFRPRGTLYEELEPSDE